MTSNPKTIFTVENLLTSQLELSESLNKAASTTGRVFITDKDDSASHVYIKSNNLFVERITQNEIICRCIDDDSKSMLDEIDFHVLNNYNQKKKTFLDAEYEKINNFRNNIKFTREDGSYIPLIVTDQLKIIDSDRKTKLEPLQLLHKIIKVIFSPLCVDYNKETKKFGVKFYGFTIQVVDEIPPSYILLELNDEGVKYMGGGDLDGEPAASTLSPTNKNVDFGPNPF